MQCHAKLAKVTHIPSDHYQSVHDSCRRGGVRSSVRASGARSNSFRSGLVNRSSLRHCSMGSSTAVSTPRLVTICGPSASVVSNNSLNFDFAS